MQFVSLMFLLFLVGSTAIYYLCPQRVKKFIVLFANLVFYASFGLQNLCILVMMMVLSFFGGKVLSKREDNKNKKRLILFVVLSLLPLFILKYCGFFVQSLSELSNRFAININLPKVSFMEPIGISFFTFKVISFLAESWKGTIKEKISLLDYAIYISFFPAITSGPIDRPNSFLEQLDQPKIFDERQVMEGILMALWGYFEKMILADRLAIIVGAVYGEYDRYTGFVLLLTSIFYTLQIYYDFAGYTNIARGVARIWGYTCQENFEQPYFSHSIREFWQRWHMSLSSWLKDYVYIPLGGNRKGIAYKYRNLLITFLVSGFWHGAGWNYIAWGLLHGFYQVIGDSTWRVRRHLKQKLHYKDSFLDKAIQMAITFLLVNFAWILFRGQGGITGAIEIIRRIFLKGPIYVSWIWESGITKIEFLCMIVAGGLVCLVDGLRYHKKSVMKVYFSSPVVCRFLALYILIFTILIWGIYGPGYDLASFIYFHF